MCELLTEESPLCGRAGSCSQGHHFPSVRRLRQRAVENQPLMPLQLNIMVVLLNCMRTNFVEQLSPVNTTMLAAMLGSRNKNSKLASSALPHTPQPTSKIYAQAPHPKCPKKLSTPRVPRT